MSQDTMRPRPAGERRWFRGLTGNGVRLMQTVHNTAVDLPPVPAAPPIPPGVMHWYGRATGSWWAIVPGRNGARLLEAPSEDALARKVWGRP